MSLQNKCLFFIAILISGMAWSLIPSQHYNILPEFSIAYRFFLGFSILFSLSYVKGLIKKLSLRDHLMLCLVGICLYALFCSLSYRATDYLSTGLISLFVALVVIPNTIFEYCLTRKKISPGFLVQVILTVIGCWMIFMTDPDLEHEHEFIGVWLSIMAVIIYAIGSRISMQVPHERVSKIYQTALAMLYSAVFSLVMGFLLSGQVVFPFIWSINYVIPLILLGLIFGPIVFVIYLYLVEKVGASMASYIWVAAPIVALIVSSIFEGLQLTWTVLFGVGLILFGIVSEKLKIIERAIHYAKKS